MTKKQASAALRTQIRSKAKRAFSKVPLAGILFLAGTLSSMSDAAAAETDQKKRDQIYMDMADEVIAATPIGIPYDVMKAFFNALVSNMHSSDPEKARTIHHNKRQMIDLL